jgi:hypothetical protein
VFWIVTGSGRKAASSQTAVLFALSSYVPPAWEKDVQVGRHQYAKVEWDLEFYHEKVYAYRTCSYLLSCVRRYGLPADRLISNCMYASMGARAAPFYINHPATHSKSERPPSHAESSMLLIRQYKALQMILFHQSPDDSASCMHAYAPVSLYDEISIDGAGFLHGWKALILRSAIAARFI